MSENTAPGSEPSTDAAIAAMLNEGGEQAPASQPDTRRAQAPSAEPDESSEGDQRTYSQADLDRIIGERLSRERAAAAGQIRELSAKATRLDALERERMSETERVAAEKYDAGRADEKREATTRLVDAHVLAMVTAGRFTGDEAAEILEGMDRSRFITGDYDVDTDKLAKFLGRFRQAETKPAFPDLGQGRRTPAATSTADQFAGAVEGFFR